MVVDQEEIIIILRKKLDQEDLSAAEQSTLDSWIQLGDANKELFNRLMDKDVFTQNFLEYYLTRTNSNLPELEIVSTEEKISSESSLTIHSTSRRRRIMWLAAAVLLPVLGLSILYFAKQNTRTKQDRSHLYSTIEEEALPAVERATLTLSDDRVIDLSTIKNGEVAKDGTVSIVKEGGRLVYNNASTKPSGGLQTLRTPKGGYYHLTLGDGTKVWVNSASQLSFPGVFPGSYRKVMLMEGEAYFEVARDTQRPFYVQTEFGTVEVLGTNFNIRNYAGGPMTTTLAVGSVRVSSKKSSNTALLVPGQQAAIKDGTEKVDVSNVIAADFISWKDGVFSFNNMNVKDVLEDLSRWYNVNVSYMPNANTTAFIKGKFARTGKLSWLLTQLGQITDLKFEIKDNTIIVKSSSD